MKILHAYHPDHEQMAHYVDRLASAQADMAQVQTATTAAGATALWQTWQPDIVHVHGNIQLSLPPQARIVITPHGSKPTQPCYAIIARSQMECRRLQAFGHQRVVIVLNPIITRTTTFRQTATQLAGIYRRVMDSNVRALMSDSTLTLLHALLKAGIMGDSRWVTTRIDDAAADWRQLLIYARYEGISDVMKQGADVLQLNIPDLDTDKADPFLPDGYADPVAHSGADIATLLRLTNDDIANKRLSMLHFVELHHTLTHTFIEEEKLTASLPRPQQLLLQRLLAIAQNETLLDEGFFPADPIVDHVTTSIHQQLINHLKI